MDRFSICLKKKSPRKKSKKEAVPKYNIQAIGEASRTVPPPSEIVESLSENQLSELIFDYQPQERELLNSTFGQMSPGHVQNNEISPLRLLDHVNHYFQEKNNPQVNQPDNKIPQNRRYQIVKESIATAKSSESPEELKFQFGRKPHHASTKSR